MPKSPAVVLNFPKEIMQTGWRIFATWLVAQFNYFGRKVASVKRFQPGDLERCPQGGPSAAR